MKKENRKKIKLKPIKIKKKTEIKTKKTENPGTDRRVFLVKKN